jgi:hypothetical protein
MQRQLQQFIKSVENVVRITTLDDGNPFILKLMEGISGNNYAVIASSIEPTKILFPINGIWINFNSNSKYYGQVLKLVGLNGAIDPNVDITADKLITDGDFINSWVKIGYYEDIFNAENIYYLQGPAGPQGPQGPAGMQGPAALIDYPAVIAEALTRVNLVLFPI